MVWVTLSPPAGARGWRLLRKGLGSPSAPPTSLCECVLCAGSCGNWAQAQGELTVCTNTRWGEGGQEKEETRKAGRRTEDCLSFLEVRTGSLQEQGHQGQAAEQPRTREGKDPDGPLKDRRSDPSECEQVYFQGTPHFWLYRQQGDTGTSGMHESRKISPGSMRTNHSSSSPSAMPRAPVPGVRAGVARWTETMPLSKA